MRVQPGVARVPQGEGAHLSYRLMFFRFCLGKRLTKILPIFRRLFLMIIYLFRIFHRDQKELLGGD